MTVSTTARTAGPFPGSGAVSVFAFGFKVFLTSDVLTQFTSATGVFSAGTLGVDYTVSLNANQTTNPGGNVITTVPLPTGASLTLSSQIAPTQNVVLTNPGGWYPQVVSDALDKLTIVDQQLLLQLGGALRVPELNGVSLLPSAAKRAGLALIFDGNGQPAVGTGPLAASPVVATMVRETQTSTAGKTVFTLTTMAYSSVTPGSILVIVGGAVIAATAMTQTSPTVVTLAVPVGAGVVVEFIAGNFTSLANGSFATVNTVGANTTLGPSYEFRRNAEYAGGNASKVNSNVRVVTFVDNPGATTLEWALLVELHNSATGGENTAIYGQATKNTGAGPTFAATIECIDNTGADPTTGAIGLEVDIRGEGSDVHNNRVCIDVVATRPTGSVAPSMFASYGLRFQTNNDPTCSFGTLIGTAANVHANLGLDLSGAIIVGAAVKLANAHAIQFDTSSLQSTGDLGLDHVYGGTLQNRLLKTGGLQVGTVKVVGARQNVTGSRASGAALLSLLAALSVSGHGLFTDNTTA